MRTSQRRAALHPQMRRAPNPMVKIQSSPAGGRPKHTIGLAKPTDRTLGENRM